MDKEKRAERWVDRYWNSAEGIRLHYRDYPGPAELPPLLCIPGLTRNAADFEPVADHVAGEWRVIAVDLRGRGGSAFDPQPERYGLPAYAADLTKLLDQLGIADAVFVGTSLGGLITMYLAVTHEERIAGALLNDIGPDIDRDGLEFIAGFLGKDTRFASWDEAAAALERRNCASFPKWDQAAWLRYAHRIAREEDGEIRFDYDMRLVDNFKLVLDAPPVDAWPSLEGLKGKPVAILRGALSNLFSAATAARMVKELGSSAELTTIPDVGHAPTFDEPPSLAALDRLLAKVRAFL